MLNVSPSVATVGPMAEVSVGSLEAYIENPLEALYISSLSGLDVQEPGYIKGVIAKRLAHGKGGSVVRNLVQAVSCDTDAWQALQDTINSFFGYELAKPSGEDPITLRYRLAQDELWHDVAGAASGFLQTVLVHSALLHSDAGIFLVDEPDAHLHAFLKEMMYRLLKEYGQCNGCPMVIATHSSKLIEQAARESGNKLFTVTESGLDPIDRKAAKDLLQIPAEQLVHAMELKRVLYVEGWTDCDNLRT